MSSVPSSAICPDAPTSAFDAAAVLGRPHVERRQHARFSPLQITPSVRARLRYGDSVDIIDISAGGTLIETTVPLRLDKDVVLEITHTDTGGTIAVIARVLRCEVSGILQRVRYRGACAFKRTLEHPMLAAARPSGWPPPPSDSPKPELALKTIVEGYRRRVGSAAAVGPWRDAAGLLGALSRLREATLQRSDPAERRIAELLGDVLPPLQRGESPDVVAGHIQDSLRRFVPLVALHQRPSPADAPDGLTLLHVWADRGGESTVAAELAAGFVPDSAHLRLLKAGAYLLGLADALAASAGGPIGTTRLPSGR